MTAVPEPGAKLAGRLALALTGGFQPDYFDAFTIMTFSGHNGKFESVTGAFVNANMTLHRSTAVPI